MKYYELMRYADNAVGAVFDYCTDKDIDKVEAEFAPDKVTEITKEIYQHEIERKHRKHIRFVTGYPK